MKNSKMEDQIKEIQKALQERHPNWPQDKARWIAMKILGAK